MQNPPVFVLWTVQKAAKENPDVEFDFPLKVCGKIYDILLFLIMLEYRVERTTTSKEEFMLISHIMGKEVLDKSTNKIGLVADIEYNFPLWTIKQLVVRMGILKKINIGVEKIDKIGDKVILKVTKDELVKTVA